MENRPTNSGLIANLSVRENGSLSTLIFSVNFLNGKLNCQFTSFVNQTKGVSSLV